MVRGPVAPIFDLGLCPPIRWPFLFDLPTHVSPEQPRKHWHIGSIEDGLTSILTTDGSQATRLTPYLLKLDAVLLAAPCSVLQGEFIYLIHN